MLVWTGTFNQFGKWKTSGYVPWFLSYQKAHCCDSHFESNSKMYWPYMYRTVGVHWPWPCWVRSTGCPHGAPTHAALTFHLATHTVCGVWSRAVQAAVCGPTPVSQIGWFCCWAPAWGCPHSLAHLTKERGVHAYSTVSHLHVVTWNLNIYYWLICL